jgi:hypothetical protein
MSPEDELRDRLSGLADRVGPPSSDGRGLAGRVAREAADRRRTSRGVLVALGCVVLLGVAVPQLIDGDAPAAAPASGAASDVPEAAGRVPGGAPADYFTGPTRGSLAGDDEFLDGVTALPWAAEPPVRAADGTILYYLPNPPVEARRVVFAGDVPGGRWALVVGGTPRGAAETAGVPPEVVPNDTLAAAWFTGPPGATADQMTLANEPSTISTDWPAALTDPRNGVLVVVAAPGDAIEVSQRPMIDAEGQTSREWRPVETDDGIAVTRVSPFPRPYDGSTSYRVLRDGRLEARDMPWSIFYEELVDQPLPIEYPRGRPGELGDQAARFAATNVLGELGLSTAQATVTAPWVGPLPNGGDSQAAVVTITLPSGAVVVTSQWLMPQQPDGSYTGGFCGQSVLPAGPPAERRVHALACEVVDGTTGAPMSTDLVVVAPPEVALVRTYDGDRVFLSEHSTRDGIVVVPMPLGTDTVEAVTAGGVTLGRVDLLGNAVDFGD